MKIAQAMVTQNGLNERNGDISTAIFQLHHLADFVEDALFLNARDR